MDTKKYRLITHKVAAVQITPENANEVVAWVESRGDVVASVPWDIAFFIFPASGMPPIKVAPGEWVIFRNDTWHVLPDGLFKSMYEESHD